MKHDSTHMLTVAIDGPSGSGKSTVSRAVARARGYAYLDTGAMYRAATAAVLGAGVDPSDAAGVERTVAAMSLDCGTDPEDPAITLDGIDVGELIRGPEVTAAVSAVSAVPAVRALLVRRQREAVAGAAASGRGIVVEGRDIGTVVLTDADVKVFLVADPLVRAQRRAAQLDAEPGVAAASGVTVTMVQRSLERRDAADSGRETSPLRAADDAVTVDASVLGVEEVVRAVLDLLDQVES